ncbi:MAG: chemotaxis protein CheW [Syntrophobacteraceae bacterium]|jgi:purine-binding chemotaxis protein CheW|nr:chemotaxis protein CheW [Syntrophobacteraceae bacterium]
MFEASSTALEAQGLAVACFVGNALFGVDAEPVQEIVRVGYITPVHHAPDYVVGIMNLRGRIVTVIDLGMKLELGLTGITPESRILIVEWKGEHVGLFIEQEGGVVVVNPTEMRAPPDNIKGAHSTMLEGVVLADGHLMALLNLSEVLEPRDGPARS